MADGTVKQVPGQQLAKAGEAINDMAGLKWFKGLLKNNDL